MSVLAPKLLQGSYDPLALSAGYEGGLLLAAARTAGSVTRLAHLGVRDDEVTVVDRFETQDPAQLLAGDDARDNRVGAHYLTTGTAGFRPVVVPHGAFVTAAPGATANPVFP